MQENNVGDFLCISWSLQQSSAIFEALGGVIINLFFIVSFTYISEIIPNTFKMFQVKMFQV